ncbi:high light inducible protein hli10 [cyanobiont of Ornithocercus magnificus]|nr:high light inducible protein hli10 [cyanobiont of Ornithocercus magnificus]
MFSYFKSTEVQRYLVRAERLNGYAAMVGMVAALGAYAVTGQLIPGIW